MRLPYISRLFDPAVIGAWANATLTPVRRHWLGSLVFSTRGAIGALELLLVIGCAHQVALMFWVVATPSSIQVTSGPLSIAGSLPFQVPKNLRLTTENIFQRSDFAKVRTQNTSAAPATALNLQLFGMRSPSGAGSGSAIIRRPDGTQDVFFVGQSIIDGVTLEAIRADHVAIRRTGIFESLYLDQARAPTPKMLDNSVTANAVAEPPRRRLSATASELFGAVQLSPGRTAAGEAGLAVRPGSDASRFTEAGFETGDILVAVNGQPMGQLSTMPTLVQSLQDASRFTITLDRRGQSLTYQLLIDR